MKKRAVADKQPLEIRRQSFKEVSTGLSLDAAVAEAERCLNCKNPLCSQGCPVEVEIPQFISLVKEKRFEEALSMIKRRNSLPAVCGRVCPQENQCEKHCILGKKGEPVAIGLLERFVADMALDNDETQEPVAKNPPTGEKVAVVGSGPAGLTAAADLALMGYRVTIFESLHAAGGVLRYGIPEFRLPKAIVDKEVEYVRSLGVDIEYNVVVGQTVTFDDLRDEGFKAIFVSTGAGLPYFLGIPGENLGGVYSANEFLTRVNLMKAYKFPEYDTPVRVGRKVCVVGGGNVAMDAARTAARLGAESVTIVYRRSLEELPARHEEVEHAIEEGIHFECLSNPVRINGGANGEVISMECIKMSLGEPDSSGRRRPVAVEGSEFAIDADTVVIAVGQGPNPILIRNASELKLSKHGYIETNMDTGATNVPGVYAGGDIVTGAATVIAAMGSGKLAAKSIDNYLREQADSVELAVASSDR